MPSGAERLTWRHDNEDLIGFLQARGRSSRFLGSLWDSFQTYGSLTAPQTAAGRRIMAEWTDTANSTEVSTGATADEAINIPNGVYTVNDGSEHLTYQVYTVRRGTLAGKRVIKRQMQYGEFKAFAFLLPNGSMRVWRSFYEDEARNERYIVWARVLVAALGEHAADQGASTEADYEFTYGAEGGYTIQVSVRCRRCNRALTDPTSISLNIGPECRSQDQRARTSAANAHEVIASWQVVEQIVADEDTTVHAEAEPVLSPVQQERLTSLITALGETRARTNEYNAYGVRTCPYCLRDNFTAQQGLGRHTASCRLRYNHATAVTRATRLLQEHQRACGLQIIGDPPPQGQRRPRFVRNRSAQQAAPQPVAATAQPSAREPNRSALGTVVGGEVWIQ